MTTAVQVPEVVELEIAARDVWKCFRRGVGYVTVLEALDLEVRRGEFVCLVGPSGCGKSTLLAILAGLDLATLGDVRVGGSSPAPGQGVGSAFVFQRDLLLDWRTVLDNVLIGYHLRGEQTRPHVAKARQLLEQVGLHDTESMYPSQLSGGMRQRVAICRALVNDPEVMFMDEPFGALDALTRERLNDDLLAIAGSHQGDKTVVFVTHDVGEAVFLGDRVVVMGARPGRILDDITIELPNRDPSVRDLPAFTEYAARVRASLRRAEELAGVTSEELP